MLKILSLVTIGLIALAIGAPNIYAQQQTEWKTYINPIHKFTIQYPYTPDSDVHDGVGSDIVFNVVPHTLLQIEDLNPNNTIMNYTTQLSQSKILHPITQTQYANMSALTFTTYNDDEDVTKFVVFERSNQVYTFLTSVKYDNYDDIDIFDKMINSIKFFD